MAVGEILLSILLEPTHLAQVDFHGNWRKGEFRLMQHDRRARGRGEHGGKIFHPEILGRGLDFH